MLKKTRLVCTMGPACDNEETLRKMMENGMNVARFNFSHGSYEEHLNRYNRVVKVRTELGLPVATLFDSKGPEIRFRLFEGGKITVNNGDLFTLTTKELLGNNTIGSISYKNLINDVSVGTSILVNDGLIELKVEEITDTDIVCRVINGGVISDRKAINVPGVHLSIPFLSDVDKNDLEFAMKTDFDFFALSFVRCAEDVLEVCRLQKEHGNTSKLIAKIESQEGVENLDEIIDAADGIMVARGDMGVEIPFEKVPVVQKDMINKCLKSGKFVIVATQMLESMTHNPRPTRAEVNDVANAIFDQTSAVMLSGESAAGDYPVEAVKTMSRICREIEKTTTTGKFDISYNGNNLASSISCAACSIASIINADAIIPVSLSGSTIRKVSGFRPNIDIIGCSTDERVCRETSLMWGVTPQLVTEQKDGEALIREVIDKCKASGLIKSGNRVVIVAGFPLGVAGVTNMIRVVDVE